MRGEWGISIRRACGVLLVDTSTYHYKSRRAGQAGLEQRIKRFAKPACAMAIGAFMCCCVARVSRSTRRRRGAFIANWACNYVTRRQSVGSKRSVRTGTSLPSRTKPGPWTCMISSQLAGSFACSRSLTRSHASRRRWNRAFPSAVRMSSRCWKELAEKWGYRQRSGSTKAPSLCHAMWICGPTSVVSRLTSPAQVSRPTHRQVLAGCDQCRALRFSGAYISSLQRGSAAW
jgi:putative transposase